MLAKTETRAAPIDPAMTPPSPAERAVPAVNATASHIRARARLALYLNARATRIFSWNSSYASFISSMELLVLFEKKPSIEVGEVFESPKFPTAFSNSSRHSFTASMSASGLNKSISRVLSAFSSSHKSIVRNNSSHGNSGNS